MQARKVRLPCSSAPLQSMAATVSRLDQPRPPPHRICACGRQRRDTNARMGIVTRTAECVNTLAASLTGRDELTRRRCGFLHTPVLDTSSTQRRRRCSNRSRSSDTERAPSATEATKGTHTVASQSGKSDEAQRRNEGHSRRRAYLDAGPPERSIVAARPGRCPATPPLRFGAFRRKQRR